VSFCEKVGPLPLPRGRTVLRLHACPSSGETRKVAPETCRRIFHPRTAEQMLALFHGLLAAVPAAASSSSPSGSLTVTCTLLAVATCGAVESDRVGAIFCLSPCLPRPTSISPASCAWQADVRLHMWRSTRSRNVEACRSSATTASRSCSLPLRSGAPPSPR